MTTWRSGVAIVLLMGVAACAVQLVRIRAR